MRNYFRSRRTLRSFGTGLGKSGALRFSVACDFFWREEVSYEDEYNKIFVVEYIYALSFLEFLFCIHVSSACPSVRALRWF
jgi:hypothetical protein